MSGTNQCFVRSEFQEVGLVEVVFLIVLRFVSQDGEDDKNITKQSKCSRDHNYTVLNLGREIGEDSK
jgi:hypothetical protein